MTAALLGVLRAYGLRIVVLVAVWVGFAVTTPTFGGEGALFAVLQNFALLGLIAVGLSVTFVAGELDLSIASTAALSGVVAVHLGNLGLLPAIAVSTVGGALLGAAQGGCISALMINSLVFTIGSQIAIRGLAYVVSGDGPSSLANLGVSDPLLTTWHFLAPDTVVALAIFLLLGLFLAYTRAGRDMYAVGGGRVEAVAAGVPVRRATLVAFAVSGACAALAGALASLKSGGVSPDAYGDLILNAPAAVLIGGFSLYGGRGNVWNVVLGVGILSELSVGLGARGVQSYTVDLFVGSLLMVVVVADFAFGRLGERHRQREAARQLLRADARAVAA